MIFWKTNLVKRGGGGGNSDTAVDDKSGVEFNRQQKTRS